VFLLEYYYEFYYGEVILQQIFYDFGFSLKNLLEGKFWVFLTSIFLHGSPEHLILNMLALYFFGRAVEIKLGRKKFLIAFFTSAVIGDFAIILASMIGLFPPEIPTIGISAAVFGLMGTAMLVKPFEFILFPYLVPIPLVLVALLYTLYNIAAFLLVFTAKLSTNVSYVSHIGGLAGGMLFGFRQEGSKKGFIIIIILLTLLVVAPIIWVMFEYLEIFNYATMITRAMK
jgi:membrane associated rhomboid family serine protease